MKFEDVKFKDKPRVRKHVIWEIEKTLHTQLDMNRLSELAIRRYLEMLIADQDYNVKTNVFYDKTTNRKLSIDFLTTIAHEYILEHISEFTKK